MTSDEPLPTGNDQAALLRLLWDEMKTLGHSSEKIGTQLEAVRVELTARLEAVQRDLSEEIAALRGEVHHPRLRLHGNKRCLPRGRRV
jgi:hypothetical protein